MARGLQQAERESEGKSITQAFMGIFEYFYDFNEQMG